MYRVDMRFFEDEDNGIWGVAPQDSLTQNFDPFWDGIGLFHDVFEHYFENKHRHFRGSYAYNIAGEVAAMGHAAYYYGELCMARREVSYFDGFDSCIRDLTLGRMSEALAGDDFAFGDELLCKLPYQRPTHNNMLESIARSHYEEILTLEGYRYDPEHPYYDEQTHERAKQYEQSITQRKLNDLYRWGYKRAKQIAPATHENRIALDTFITFWRDVCKANEASAMTAIYHKLIFTVRPGQSLTWSAKLIRQEGGEVRVHPDRLHYTE